jgi:NRAMP (natural resistance-associated macrophage protein)-like metal ion transporter
VGGRSRLVPLLAVLGPGLLAGLSDDDPAGITTYSILGADHGYRLLWVLLLATGALILFHELGARMGVVTGQGLTGLIRHRYGVRWACGATLALLAANVGTMCAELAGIAAALELAGVTRYVSVPLAAVGIAVLVLRAGFHRVEHVLLLLSAVFVTYVASGILAHPSWSAAGRGLVVPDVPATRAAAIAAAATVGTTLAPWGLAFIQSYAVDKRLRERDLTFERIDVVVGAVLTGAIGLFVVVASAATLHAQGRSIADAADAAVALRPLAGSLASTLFAAGLLGAAVLAAAVLPLSTAYSVSEVLGHEAALDDSLGEAPWFYGSYALVMAVSVAVVLVPGAPLISILYASQVLNAVLLLPLLVLVHRIAGDPDLMGAYRSGRVGSALTGVAIAGIAVCIGAMAVFSLV